MRLIRMIAVILCIAMLTFMDLSVQTKALSEKEITAPSAVLMDAKSGKVLFEKNAHEIRACASITKVMTLILVMEAIDSGKLRWEDTVTASAHAASMGGSDIWLEAGETMTVDEMVKATIVASANDAAVALAEKVSGSEEAFVSAMNQKAKTLGMKETVFKNCNGLDEEGHVTSAYDVALMSRELLRHPKILSYSGIWMDELRNGKTQLVNTNKLLKSYEGITGLKTGTTSQAGSCISATAERDGLSLIAVVLGSATGTDRFKDAAKVLDHGFAGYGMYLPEMPKEAERELTVTNGMESIVRTECHADEKILIEKGSASDIKAEVYLPEKTEAPVEKGEVIGKLIYKSGGKQIAEYPIAAADPIKEINFRDVANLFLKSMSDQP